MTFHVSNNHRFLKWPSITQIKKLAQDSLDNFLVIVLKDSKGVLFYLVHNNLISPFQQNELADINKVHVNDCQKSH